MSCRYLCFCKHRALFVADLNMYLRQIPFNCIHILWIIWQRTYRKIYWENMYWHLAFEVNDCGKITLYFIFYAFLWISVRWPLDNNNAFIKKSRTVKDALRWNKLKKNKLYNTSFTCYTHKCYKTILFYISLSFRCIFNSIKASSSIANLIWKVLPMWLSYLQFVIWYITRYYLC